MPQKGRSSNRKVDPGATIAEGFQGKVSPMPPMGVLLKPQELADVMAYIMTLK
jgi:mono/diheme cytochrome c family protein